MKFKDLTDIDKKRISDVYNDKEDGSWERRAFKLGDEFGVSERTIRKWCSEKLNLKEKEEVEPEQYLKAKARTFDSTKKRFIITWAQNNTPVHKPFMRNIEAYAKYIDADIHVIAGRYRNPTSIWSENQKDAEYWRKRELEELGFKDVKLEEVDSELAEGVVVSQSVQQGEIVDKNQTIILKVSNGNFKVTIPNFKGLTLQEVISWATPYGIEVETTYVCDNSDKGTTVSQEPKYGVSVKNKSKIKIVISDGKCESV